MPMMNANEAVGGRAPKVASVLCASGLLCRPRCSCAAFTSQPLTEPYRVPSLL